MKRTSVIGRGFSLIELLVVIGIIAILASLLLPALLHAKARAQSVACKNRERQIGVALESYLNDHQQKYPRYFNPYDASLDAEAGHASTRYWWAKLTPYYPLKWTKVAYHCPGYKGAIADGSNHLPMGSFAYNGWGVSWSWEGTPLRTDEFGLRVGLNDIQPRPVTSVAQIKVPSEMLAVTESRFLRPVIDWPGGWDLLVCGFLKTKPPDYAFDAARHGETYNLLFCDGHVGAMNPYVLFDPTKTASMWNSDHQPHPELWVP